MAMGLVLAEETVEVAAVKKDRHVHPHLAGRGERTGQNQEAQQFVERRSS